MEIKTPPSQKSPRGKIKSFSNMEKHIQSYRDQSKQDSMLRPLSLPPR